MIVVSPVALLLAEYEENKYHTIKTLILSNHFMKICEDLKMPLFKPLTLSHSIEIKTTPEQIWGFF